MAEPSPIKVLVVDDEPLAVERLQLLLARVEGVTLVGTANDGEGALRIAEAVSPDVVLLDIAMPGMDGIDVARALSEATSTRW
jgi:two-component system response regulator AlgR